MARNIFNTIQVPKVASNFFDLSHDVKLSFKMGSLVPICAVDVIPGDRFSISYESMLRFSALIAPVMHEVTVTQHYFFVPNRILWDNWEAFITQQSDIEAPYLEPVQSATAAQLIINKGSIADYFGLPTMVVPIENVVYTPKINALPFAAYWRIMAEYYFDQNLQEETIALANAWSNLIDGKCNDLTVGAGSTMVTNCFNGFVPKRAWKHDYFTGALPFAQKGDQVEMPIADFNDVPVITDPLIVPAPGRLGGLMQNLDGSTYDPATNSILYADGTSGRVTGNEDSLPLYYDPAGSMYAETSQLSASSASINNLRRAFRLQEWLERNARGGTRYVESIYSHFNERSPDSRLQRPEYIGGAVQKMVISEVLSTTQTLNGEGQVVNPVGQMSGHGISVGGSKVLRYHATEHGWIIGLISVQPNTAYQQGIAKKFTRPDVFDYLWPTFAHIGEQEILSQEVYFDPEESEADNVQTFGYVPRYAEYRFENNRVAGDFRDTLDFWHLGRIFEERPFLNEQFIQADPSNRIFAVETGDHIYAHVLLRIKARRKLPKFGTPSF